MSNDEAVELLRELVRLTRVQVHPVAKDMLRDELFAGDEPEMDRVRVYAALDGSAQREVADEAGVHQTTVSRWSRDWRRKGLVDAEGVAVFDPYDFFPDLKEG